MNLFYATLAFSLAFLWMKKTFAGADDPAKPFWVRENVVLYISAPTISGLIALGSIFFFKTIAEFPPTLAECGYSVTIVVTTLLMRRIKKWSPAETLASTAGTLINVDFNKDDPSPKNESNGPRNPTFRKAA